MAITHLLDTSVYSQPLRKTPLQSVVHNWKSLGDGTLCVSSLCEAELLQGLEMKNSPTLWEAWHTILENRLPLIEFDGAAARVYAQLQATAVAAGNTRPVFDLLIAASAISRNLVLATCNARDFTALPGLRLEDWTRVR